jgi:riboflavin synthase
MFTGIIELTGRLRDRPRPAGSGVRLEVIPAIPLRDLAIGESIANNGVCLTAEPGSTAERLIFFASPETLQRTTLGLLEAGQMLNLERSLRADARLGGHLVMGHVDGLGTIRRWEQQGESWELEVEFPSELARFIASKGSIAVDGISLTVVDLHADSFTVAVIPHTAGQTTLAGFAPGRRVNLEVDMLARYVVRALECLAGKPDAVNADLLRRAGFA